MCGNLRHLHLPVDICKFSLANLVNENIFLLSVTFNVHFFVGVASTSGNDLPVHYLRLLAPPLQLLSAAMWQVVQQGLVNHYGMLEEFVTTVTELVPELMSYSQRAQLILGLRARVSNIVSAPSY